MNSNARSPEPGKLIRVLVASVNPVDSALALPKLYRPIGHAAKMHDMLAPALKGLAPTPEMPEITEAQALLRELAPDSIA